MKKIRRLLFDLWMLMPFGYLLRFHYGGMPNSTQRVTLNKNLWITVDGGKGTAKDTLPITMVSEQLINECEKRLIKKYKVAPLGA